MTPEEAQIIKDVFARIRSAGPIPNDPQARSAISQELIANPDAGIGLIQLLVGTEQQRAQLAAQCEQLQAQLRNAGQSQPPSSGGLFGFGRTTPPPPPPPQQSGPWGGSQQYAPPPPQASAPWGSQQPQAAPQSSFLRTALGSAAGMAGGLFAFEAIRDVFGGHGGGGLFGGYGGGFGGGPTEYITENTYIDDNGGGGFDNGSSFDDGGGFDTSSDDSSFGGGDDSSFG